MNNTFCLEQISRTSNLAANLMFRQKKLGVMAQFMELKPFNLTLKQSETAKSLGMSSSTLQRYRFDIKLLSPFKNPSNSNR